MRARTALFTTCMLTGCGGIAVVERGPDPWSAPPGSAAPLPANGSSPGDPSLPDPSTDPWSGWWVRYPAYGAYPTSVAVLGEDVVIAGEGPAEVLDLGAGPLAAGQPYGEQVQFIARVSGSGVLLWAQPILGGGNGEIAIDTASRIHITMPHGLRCYGTDGQLLDEQTFGEGVQTDAISPTHDGGLLVGLDASGPVDLGMGPLALGDALPVGVLVRLDAAGHLVWWREVAGAHGFEAVGENGAGHVLAVTSGAATATWGDSVFHASTAEAMFAVCACRAIVIADFAAS